MWVFIRSANVSQLCLRQRTLPLRYDDPLTTETHSPPLSEPPADHQAYRPLPGLAAALRAQTEHILKDWRASTLLSMPEIGELTVKEFEDDISRILAAMADALESSEQPDLKRLMRAAPAHGFHRFLQKYDLGDLFAEERILRRVIVSRVEIGMDRQCKPDEAAVLHSMIDIMLQQGVLALVYQQRKELELATEVQRKYLAFLSHDLSNNFLLITLNMEFIEYKLSGHPELSESACVLGQTLAAIRHTRAGMLRLLEHERLANADALPAVAPLSLRKVVEPIVAASDVHARTKGVRIKADIDGEIAIESDADLLTIILQNLIGNAVKHASSTDHPADPSVVRVRADRVATKDAECWKVSVVDQGPGIPAERVERLFKAFQRDRKPGQSLFAETGGFGLGLAIASEAARLIGTSISVESEPGQGSTFSFLVPAAR